MSLARLLSRAELGMEAPPVEVEVHLGNGLPALSIVGLPETSVKESRERVRAALLSSRFEFPARRITVNLAPADIPKEGGRFDLPIALGILAASGQIPEQSLKGLEAAAELGLSGELRPVRGILPTALAARAAGHALLIAGANAAEAAMVSGLEVYAAEHLLQVCAHLAGEGPITPWRRDASARTPPPVVADLRDVRGQHHAKRALEIAAAGGHHLLMIGPPGTGKTLLANRLAGIMPTLTEDEALETAALLSVSERGFAPEQWGLRPVRAPHHTASGVALVGGGSHPRPGEISLAHNGVLFLDELTEFDRRVLEVLREPLESGRIVISRAARQAEFPARFQLVAAMNPCPQGYDCDLGQGCRCTPEQQRRHRARISAPLLDRIDLQIQVPRVPAQTLRAPDTAAEDSAAVRARVTRCRAAQLDRQGTVNALLEGEALDAACRLGTAETRLLEQAMQRFGYSARAYHRILRVARTIADLGESPGIEAPHIGEALGYRAMDRWRVQA